MVTAPVTTPILEMRGVHADHPGRTGVLRGVDLVLDPGQRIGLVGANGAGKTTLLHAAMGLLPISRGEIRLFGQEMKNPKDFEKPRLRLGFLFQNADDQLFCPTVLEDVAFGPLNQGLSAKEATERARSTLADLGLGDYEDRPPYRLSGGEKKLVSLATVLSMRPEALLLDEPTNGLDQETRKRIIEVLNGSGVAVLAVSHEPDFLSRTTDTILVMREGRIRPGEAVVHTHEHAHEGGDASHSHSGSPHQKT